jgi:TRAP-type C4-dicarboxylate transport system substrate-binding protein
MIKYFTFISILLILSFSVTSAPIKIVCSTDNPKGSMHVIALEKFGELVAKYSNGRLAAEIHFRGNKKFPAILGEEDNMNMVMSNYHHIHVTAIASGNASLKASVLEFLMLPYIFENKQSATQLFRSNFMMGDINKILVTKHNIRAIGWLIGGFRHLTTSKKPVQRLEDIKGLVIRTPRNRLMRDTYIALGAEVIPLNWGDTFEALKKGDVEGQENPYSVIIDSKFWDANQRYVTNNGPFLWVGPILINEEFYQSLPDDLKKVVIKAGQEASEYEWAWENKRSILFKDDLFNNNMQVLDLEDKQRWIDSTRPLWEKYYKFIGYGDSAKGKKIVENVLINTERKTDKP